MYGGQSGEFVSAYWCLKGQFRTLHNSRESFKRGVYCFHVDIHTVLACSFFFVIVYCIFFRLIRVNKICSLQDTGIVVGVLIVTSEYSSVKKLCACL